MFYKIDGIIYIALLILIGVMLVSGFEGNTTIFRSAFVMFLVVMLFVSISLNAKK